MKLEIQDIDSILVIIEPNLIKRAACMDDFLSAIWDFDQELRRLCKYEDNECACKIRELFYECLDDNNISLDEMCT